MPAMLPKKEQGKRRRPATKKTKVLILTVDEQRSITDKKGVSDVNSVSIELSLDAPGVAMVNAQATSSAVHLIQLFLILE